MKGINDFPPIKTNDGSRPEGVHNKGTVLFYKIYQKYGRDILKKLVRGFTELNVKNTYSFIEMVRKSISKEVAEEMEIGIEE